MLENGLTAWQLPGVYDASGGAVFHARGDSVNVLRCAHGNSTVNLRKDRKEAPLGFQAERAGAVLRVLARVRALAPAASATTRRLLLAWVLSFRRAREAAAQAARTRRSVAQRIQCACKPQSRRGACSSGVCVRRWRGVWPASFGTLVCLLMIT